MKSQVVAVFVAIVLVVVALPLVAADRVAQISEAAGTVAVTRAADQSTDVVDQVGPRVRNGSVFPGDVVATGPESSATIVFSDGTTLKLAHDTSLTVKEVDFSSLMAAGQVDKPVGRVIQVLAGDVWSHVVPNAGVATEFETPTGVAAVKGTTLTISVDRPVAAVPAS